MRRFKGLRDPRNPLSAAPEVLRNIVGATDINEEFIGGLENVLSLFICNGTPDAGPPREPVRLMLATALNYWPSGVPAELEALCTDRPIAEANWMNRAELLARSRLMALSERPEAAKTESTRSFHAFAVFALERRPPPERNYFSANLRPLLFSSERQIEVHEVASVSGTPAISWLDYGKGIQRIAHQIRQHGLDIDLVIGINEAGLSMSAMLSPVWQSRPALGLIRTRGIGPGLHQPILDASMLPRAASTAEAVLLCDFEAKNDNAPLVAADYVREHLPGVNRIYLAVAGALLSTDGGLPPDSEPLRFDNLACSQSIHEAGLEEIFVAAVMVGGIDPPTRSR
jgi:hypothetical protein